MGQSICVKQHILVYIEIKTPKMPTATKETSVEKQGGIENYYRSKIAELEVQERDRTQNLRRLEAQRNDLNSKVRLLREELALLQEPGSHIGEVLKVMGKSKVLVKVNPDGKYVVEVDKKINIADCTPNTRVALRNDSYMLRHGWRFSKTNQRNQRSY